MSDSDFVHINLDSGPDGEPQVQLSGYPGELNFSLEQFGQYVYEHPDLFAERAIYSSSCDFPEEHGFPDDFDVREFIERKICETCGALHVRLANDTAEDGTVTGKIVIYRGREQPETRYTIDELLAAIKEDPDRFLHGQIMFNASCDHPDIFHLPAQFNLQNLFRSLTRRYPAGAYEARPPQEDALIAAAFKALRALCHIPNRTIQAAPNRVTTYDIASELERALAAVIGCEVGDLMAIEKYEL